MPPIAAAPVRQRAPKEIASRSRAEAMIGALLALDGLAVVGMWMLSLSSRSPAEKGVLVGG